MVLVFIQRSGQQAVFYALAFFWLDGFAVPTPAQVTQTVSPPLAQQFHLYIKISADSRSHSLKRFIGIFLTVWLIISMIYFAVYMVFVEFQWQFVYYYVWLIVFGFPLWLFRDKASVIIKSWKANRHLKFFLLAYSMVLLEEIFAALLNHMSEGFNIWIFFQRVGQFWFFNILAFTGLIFAVWFLYNHFQYSFAEMFCLVGLTGLYSERIIFYIPAEWQVFIVFAPIMLFTYGLILSPALISIDISHRRRLHFLLRLALMLFAWYLFSQLPVFLLSILRNNYPFLFPSCQFIPCG